MACPHHVSTPWNPRAVWYAHGEGGVRAATGKLRERGRGATRAWPWFLGFSEAVPGFYAPVFILAPALEPSRFSKRPVIRDTPYRHRSKAQQNGEMLQVNEKEIR